MLVWSREGGGGKHSSKPFSFSICWIAKQGFQLIFFNRNLSNEKNVFVDNSRVEPTIFLMEKLSFSLKLFSGHFYGQSFIKTIRGPSHNLANMSFDSISANMSK